MNRASISASAFKKPSHGFPAQSLTMNNIMTMETKVTAQIIIKKAAFKSIRKKTRNLHAMRIQTCIRHAKNIITIND